MRSLLALALGLTGSGGIFLGLRATRRVLQQDHWRKIEGSIVDGHIAWAGEEFAARISYRYVVNDSTFTGHVVRSGAVNFNWRGPAEKTLARYPPGAEVTAFVNPSNHGD